MITSRSTSRWVSCCHWFPGQNRHEHTAALECGKTAAAQCPTLSERRVVGTVTSTSQVQCGGHPDGPREDGGQQEHRAWPRVTVNVRCFALRLEKKKMMSWVLRHATTKDLNSQLDFRPPLDFPFRVFVTSDDTKTDPQLTLTPRSPSFFDLFI